MGGQIDVVIPAAAAAFPASPNGGRHAREGKMEPSARVGAFWVAEARGRPSERRNMRTRQ